MHELYMYGKFFKFYQKICPICSKGLFAGLIFGGAYFQRGLLLEGFKMDWT